MYQIAVCDDEPAICKMVSDIIREWSQDIKVSCFSSGEALRDAYDFFDVVSLDIDMKGINGIETGRQIRERDREIKIVYLTSYRDYVAGAFEVHAFQYLLKPISPIRLRQVLEEIFRYVKKADKQRILDFYTTEGMICIDTAEICYFEFVNRKIRMVTRQNTYYMTGKISSIYERICSMGFSMPHKSFVINLLHVKNVKNLEIFMDNGDRIPLSQKKQKEWKQELTNYLSERLESQRMEGG
ncbi:MAG: LytTR family DNA-binding domain-containing protein [Lachnospiraceae bacterium]|nr:LytTR family DNA-binding domain-containing protein [Lachnospiraceae bacterium]